ncbi:hypothetical protein HHI36_020066 [Cryptolaemus montrouzieri]|uniref:Dynein regulatory complex protein 10 n=1 Tax=Cryptolaemus montrouzieri TaxID=559131 RepID=A0ABD2NAC7_9CUCU
MDMDSYYIQKIESSLIGSSISSVEYFTFSTGDQSIEITPLMTVIFVMVIDNCCDELEIINSSYKKLTSSTDPMDIVFYIPPELRFGFSDDIIREEHLKIQLSDDASEFSRLVRILCTIREALKVGMVDLYQNKTFKKLKTVVENLQHMRNDEKTILLTYRKNCKLHNNLTDDVVSEKVELLGYIKRTEDEIRQARQNFEAYLQESGVIYNTVLDWEESRIEQNLYLQNMKENISTQMVKAKKNSTDDEKVAHLEMIHFYQEHTQDLRDDILKWMVKYDEDLDSTEIEIMKVRINVEEMQDKVRNLQKKINKRSGEMRDYLDFKRQQKKEAIRLSLEIGAAIIIQKWWRNILLQRKMLAKKKRKNNKNKMKKQFKRK